MTIDELRNINNAVKSKHHSSPEHQLQCECVRWFDIQYPQLLLYAIPNGGARSATTGAMLKREGVRRGIPDLHLALPRGQYNGLYVEMKNGKKGRVSDEQNSVIEYLVKNNYKVEVCRDFDSFREIINSYINN